MEVTRLREIRLQRAARAHTQIGIEIGVEQFENAVARESTERGRGLAQARRKHARVDPELILRSEEMRPRFETLLDYAQPAMRGEKVAALHEVGLDHAGSREQLSGDVSARGEAFVRTLEIV